MLYKVLIDKNNPEINFLSYLYTGKQTYNAVIAHFNYTWGSNFQIFNLAGFSIQVKSHVLGVIENGLINIIAVKEDNQLFIDKTFEKNYPVLYKRFKSVIEECSNNKFDITYTDFCGRSRFLEFEKPKFSTIKERDELVNSLLEEVYD